MVESSFILWLSLYIGTTILLYYGADKKKVVHLILSTILYMVTAIYSFSFTAIIGDAGTWIMIGLGMMGFVVGLAYTLSGLVDMLKESNKEPKENLGL